MTVYFANKEPIDLNAIAIMGVSVKTGDSPIGFFGTGLKFSIATLLRSGCKITLTREGALVPFSAEKENIRGEEFDRVVMAGEKLGFTTKLGRTWESWQAYRELYCNCLDEGGVIENKLPEGEWGTVFAVEGEAIEQCHRERGRIFLQSEPLFAGTSAAAHSGIGSYVFYRGVRAHKLQRQSLYTYNVTSPLDLTEDRTVKHSFMIDHHVVRMIPKIDDEDMIEQILLAPEHAYEQGLDYSGADLKPSLAFMDVCFRLRMNTKANRSAIRLWEKHTDRRTAFSPVELDQFEEAQLDKALNLLRRISCPVTREDFLVVDSLGESCFGAVRANQILIALCTFDKGYRFIASTLYEEWLHRDQQMTDESRDLQNMLLDKLFGMVDRLVEVEAALGTRKTAAVPA